MNLLTHTKGQWAGQPFSLRPWQEHQIIRPLFGTLRPDGSRQYRTVYTEISRKCGKTALAAAIALYMLLGDREEGAEVYSAAVDLEQASLAFHVAAQMVRNDPELARAVEVIPSRKRIVHHPTGSFYRAIPADAASAHGYNASAVIYDELHAAPNRDLYDVLTTSMGARRQPLTFIITTAGFDRQSICWELHSYAERVRDGAVDDPTFLPILFGAPPEADWMDETVWYAANPALGDFRSLEEMRVTARQAKEVPARQNTFRRLYLCQWTEAETRWIDLDAWDASAGPPVDPEALVGRPCFAGLDLSTTEDLSALVLLFPQQREDGDDGASPAGEDAPVTAYDVLPFIWCPADGVEKRSRRDRAPYDQWAREGWLTVTDGNVVDYSVIRETIRELADRYRIVEIGFDRWNSSHLITQLQEDGATCTPVGQGFQSLAGPSKEFERLVLGRRFRHGGHPILRWMMSNVTVRTDPAGNIKPDKGKSRERIDGVVAAIVALSRAMAPQGAPAVSRYYETHAPIWIA